MWKTTFAGGGDKDKDEGVEDVRIPVVWVPGGAGKSQLILNYIREY